MSKDEIFHIITGHTRQVIPALQEHDFQQTDSLRALGANSIDRAEIIMLTLETLSLTIPMTTMAKAENMGQLAGIIHDQA